MTQARPVNLNLMTIRMPITAIASILHRISGIVIFLSLPLFLWMLGESLKSHEGFAHVKECLSGGVSRLLLWLVISAVYYHVFAGLRHIIMDFGFGETKRGGRIGAIIVFILTATAATLLGICLW